MSAAPAAAWVAADAAPFRRAIEIGAAARAVAPPNPWVGCVIVAADGRWFEGATQPGGRPHAEAVALDAAGASAAGSTAYVTLEPCAHHGRTPPCAAALVDAGVARVVVGVVDPDARVAGAGIEVLAGAGLDVVRVPEPIVAEAVESLEPYLVQRRTGRPYVVLKLAASLDGRTAAPDGSSQWITGVEARADAHALRAESDAVIVGAGTVVADDPSLTVRLAEAPRGDPRRIVLGSVPEGAKVLPAQSYEGPLGALLDDLGAQGALQVLVEGGATVAHRFHAEGLVDRYVLYLAPALFGGDDARGLFAGAGAPRLDEVWRGRIAGIRALGADLRVDLVHAGVSATDAGSR